MFDAIIIGGGFYGCMIALHFTAQGKKVLILEKEKDLMLRASFNNQARVHNGYHYPRAMMTAESSHKNYERFVGEFPECVKDGLLMSYAIAKGSKTSPVEFEQIYGRIGSPLSMPERRVSELLNMDLIDSVYTVKEQVFDADILRELLRKKLERAKVEVRYDSEVIRVYKGGVELESGNLEAKRIVNCTYSNINKLLKASGLEELPIKIENTVMPLIKVPDAFAELGVTIMDGDYFAVMPFPARGLHTVHHVKYTPLGDTQAILEDIVRFIPCMEKAELIDEIKEEKAILLANEEDDGRPSLYRENYGFGGFDIVMGSKIDTVYDVFERLDGFETKGLNVI